MHHDLETDQTADADLILRTRSGDATAFSELWRRHYPSGMAVARSITSSIDPDDLVQESYTRIYQAVLKGGGPNGSFRAYLFTSIRNTAAAWGRARREMPIDELESVVDPDSTDEAVGDALDRSLTAQAFRSLPVRWQEVLWYTEIEQMKPAEVAPLLGMKAGAVSQLAFRAREGLREAWIQVHVQSTSSDSECHWTIAHLGAHSRGNLSTRDQKRMDAHLDDCTRCLIVAAEAKDVSGRLALVMLPLVLGVAGAAGYAQLIQHGGVPAVSAATMPVSIVAGTASADGGAGSIGLEGAVLGGTGTTTGGTVSGGAITGLGALVGAGSAALVVAGVVAAVTIIPGLVSASPVTSLPSAGDADGSSISSELVPSGDIESEEMLVLELPAPEKDPETPAPRDDAPPSTAPEEQTAPQIAQEEPAADESASGEGGDGSKAVEPPVDPGEEVEPEEPVDPGEPVDPVDPADPTEPTDPTNPTDPADPEAPDGGDETASPEPEAIPITGPVALGQTEVWIDGNLKTHLTTPITGVPGATVQALIDGSAGGADQIVLDEAGAGTIDLRPTLTQILGDADVTIQYVTADGPLHPIHTTLSALGGSQALAATTDSATAEETAPAE
ncbi:sigma-70 family RNA polymerase sigma factor [Microbacterium sp. YMB-B2]|uniref:Sigma-70 family RNA polymerase sigma factor n=1 Tax=Microbacterium tenebrionis TaxID=2830665 RepID=A0A9X1LPN0_9MICO|nr:sigma-70 family RNA polymerase sigma factor [Microbacterium tenebrionis]MCC2029560.1 sigma-70 family RNA polymerase sigma factor [Microbacterium tenebrionis]